MANLDASDVTQTTCAIQTTGQTLANYNFYAKIYK